MTSVDGFTTPEMVQAERELDARIDYALGAAREAEATLDEIQQQDADDQPPTDEDVARFAAFITGHARTEAWEAVITRIDRGELTWRQVVEGLAAGRMDRQVAAAFTSLQGVPPATEDELVEIGIIPAAADRPEPAADDEPAEAEQPAPRAIGDRFYAGDVDDEPR